MDRGARGESRQAQALQEALSVKQGSTPEIRRGTLIIVAGSVVTFAALAVSIAHWPPAFVPYWRWFGFGGVSFSVYGLRTRAAAWRALQADEALAESAADRNSN
jgi:hypothetical protein